MSWPTSRGSGNRGSAELPMAPQPPRVTASWPLGAAVGQVLEFRLPSGSPAVVVVAGSSLQALSWDGELLFADYCSVTTKVLHVAQLARGPVALVLSRDRDVRLLDLVDGTVLWRHQAPEGTSLDGAGSSKVAVDGDRLCWLAAPGYSESISCFEISPSAEVRTRWVHDFAGRFDRGFGPVMVLSDVLGSGQPQVLISSRTGSGYGTDDHTDVPTESVVLGRADGHLYQAVLDLADGRILSEVAYRPDPGDYPCARPYGLLQVVGPSDALLAVLVSCQVEEYYSVTGIAAGQMHRAWGEFVEKDWPIDVQELRPQTTSIAASDSHDPILIIGHFDGSGWTTRLRSARDGQLLAAVPGQYFWGTLRTSVGEVAIVSPATQRQLDGGEAVQAMRIAEPGVLTAGVPMRPITSSADVLRADISFHAARRSLVSLIDGATGRAGIVVSDGVHARWWDPVSDETRLVADFDALSAAPGIDGAIVLISGDGRLHRVTEELSVTAHLSPRGCRPEALSIIAEGTAWVFTPTGSEGTVARAGAASCTVPGEVKALSDYGGRLFAASVVDRSRVGIFEVSSAGVAELGVIDCPGQAIQMVFIDQPHRVIIAERTGVHTAAIGSYELDGRQVWRDPARGPHPNLALAAADREGKWRVAYDDHGVLVLRDAHSGNLLAERDWTAAYTTPIVVHASDDDILLRVGGVHGTEALTLQFDQLWRHTATLWRYFPGDASVADRPDGHVLACASREGVVDLIDVRTGQLIRTVPVGPVAVRPPIVAVDVTGTGTRGFVVGTAAGQLLTVDPDSEGPSEWELRFDTAIEYLAAADTTADGFTDLIVGTADGMIHLVSGGGQPRPTEPAGPA